MKHSPNSTSDHANGAVPIDAQLWAKLGITPNTTAFEMQDVALCDPSDLGELSAGARALFTYGAYEESARVYMALTALEPQNPEVWFGLAEAFLAANVVDAAGLAADVALTLDPKNPAKLVLRGQIAIEAGELELIKPLVQTFANLPISECPPPVVVQMAGVTFRAEMQTGRSIL